MTRRLTVLEIAVANLAPTQASRHADTALRVDRIEMRLDRIESRLALVDVQPA